MGYNTIFSGHFTLDKPATPEVVEQMTRLVRDEHNHSEAPSRYCQWILRGNQIMWDGGEKFYEYAAWLQYVIERVLNPAGIKLSGTVSYSGDDPEDNGILVVSDDQHVRDESHRELASSYDALLRFRDFVLGSKWGPEITEAYRDAHPV